MRRLLLVDDEINVLKALQRTLRQCLDVPVEIEVFTDPEPALLRASEVDFDVVMSDYRMPGMNGADLLRVIKAVQPDMVRVVLSASTDFAEIMNVINSAEIFRYVAKPWSLKDLRTTFDAAFARRDEALAARKLVDEARAARGEMTPQEIEARRLEAEEPGITKVNWGEDGSVHL